MSCQLKRKTADISYDTCSSEEDKGGTEKVKKKIAKKIRKSKIEQTFKIHYSGFLTSYDRNERSKSSIKLTLDIDTTEDRIRDFLKTELPQLRGKKFSFFTKDNDGRHYRCPCKLKCEGRDHIPTDWNARNISRAARSNRTVYILIEIDYEAPSTSGYDADFTNSHINEQERDSASNLHQSVSCPDLPSTGSTGLENRNMTQFVGQNNSDLRRQQLEITQFPRVFPVETDRQGDRDRGKLVVQESPSTSSRSCETILQRHENRKFTSLVNLEQFPQPKQIQMTHLQRVLHGETTDSLREQCQEGAPTSSNTFSSGFESISAGSSHTSSPNVQDEFDVDSLLEYLENKEPPIEIKEIVPNNGDVKGGSTFYLELATHCIDKFEVQFGQNDPIDVEKIDEKHYKGAVPKNASSLAVEVKVRIVNTLRDTKNAVTFTYTDKNLKERHEDKENIKYEAELRELLLETARKFCEMNLKSKEATCIYDEHGGSKTQPLPLLRVIADTAARINSTQFFEILLSTHVGHTAFREYQPELKGIAKANGNEKLASLLEKKYLVFGDDENDINGKEDCNEDIVEDLSSEKWKLQSTDFFKRLNGYLGDGESSASLSSSQVSVEEIFPGVLNGRDQSAACHAKGEMSDENKGDEESLTSSPPLQVLSGDVRLEEKFEVKNATPGPQDSNASDKWPSKGGAKAGERRSPDVQDYAVKEPEETLETKGPEESDNYYEKGPSFGKIEIREDHTLYETNPRVEEMELVGRPFQGPSCLPVDYVPRARGSNEIILHKEGKRSGTSHEQVWIHSITRPSGNLEKQDASSTIQPSDGLKGNLHTRKLDRKRSKVSRKSHYKMNSPPRFERPQERGEIDCSFDITDSPSVHPLLELEQSLPCISANERPTGPNVIDHSKPPNNFKADGNRNNGESGCSSVRNNRVTIITFVIRVSLIGLVFGIFALGIGKEKRAFPTQEPTSGPCSLTQHWIEDDSGSHSCKDCRTCPPGQGLSKECGSSELLPSNTVVTCVPCVAGVSFSRYEDSSSCSLCSSCSQSQVVNQSCSTKWDVKCSNKCDGKDRYYDEDKGDCLLCSSCCEDGFDVVVAECKEKLGTDSKKACINRQSCFSGAMTTTLSPQSEDINIIFVIVLTMVVFIFSIGVICICTFRNCKRYYKRKRKRYNDVTAMQLVTTLVENH